MRFAGRVPGQWCALKSSDPGTGPGCRFASGGRDLMCLKFQREFSSGANKVVVTCNNDEGNPMPPYNQTVKHYSAYSPRRVD